MSYELCDSLNWASSNALQWCLLCLCAAVIRAMEIWQGNTAEQWWIDSSNPKLLWVTCSRVSQSFWVAMLCSWLFTHQRRKKGMSSHGSFAPLLAWSACPSRSIWQMSRCYNCIQNSPVSVPSTNTGLACLTLMYLNADFDSVAMMLKPLHTTVQHLSPSKSALDSDWDDIASSWCCSNVSFTVTTITGSHSHFLREAQWCNRLNQMSKSKFWRNKANRQDQYEHVKAISLQHCCETNSDDVWWNLSRVIIVPAFHSEPLAYVCRQAVLDSGRTEEFTAAAARILSALWYLTFEIWYFVIHRRCYTAPASGYS